MVADIVCQIFLMIAHDVMRSDKMFFVSSRESVDDGLNSTNTPGYTTSVMSKHNNVICLFVVTLTESDPNKDETIKMIKYHQYDDI